MPVPAPQIDSSISLEWLTMADFTMSGVHSGQSCRRSATAPLTCGVAIEVPLIERYPDGELLDAPE